MQRIYLLLSTLLLSSLAFADVSPPAGTKPVFNGQDFNRAGLYKVGSLYLGSADGAHTMLLKAPAVLPSDSIAFTLPATNGTANQCLATDGSGGGSWISVLRPGLAAIVNADVSASAAIARSKIANGNAAYVLINDGAGAMTEEAQLSKTRGGTGITSTATFPSSGTVTTNDAIAALTNKSLDTTDSIDIFDTFFVLHDDLDTTRRFKFDATAVSPSTTRTYGVPNADTTLVGTNVSQALTNKTLDSTSTITGATAGSFTNTGTITLPTATTTLVGRGTTDTLTNKTIDGGSNTLTNVPLTTAVTGILPPANGGDGIANNSAATFTRSGNFALTLTTTATTGITLPTTGTLATLAGSETLTNKAINGSANTLTNVSLTTAVTGTLPIGNGGTGQTTASTAFAALSPLTTKGDLSTYSSTTTRLPVGTDGQVLTADSTQTTGLKWAAGLTTSLTSAHLFVGNGSNVATDTAITGDVTISNAGVTSLATTLAGTKNFTGTVIHGSGEAGTPGAATIRGAAAAGSNVAGADLTIAASDGTGTGGSGNLLFQTAPVAGSSSTANTLATVAKIRTDGFTELSVRTGGNCGIGNICSGTSTPTITNQTNASGITGAGGQFIQVGNVVTYSFRVTGVTTSSTAAAISFTSSVPQNTNNFTSVTDAIGTCATDSASGSLEEAWNIEAVNGGQTVKVQTGKVQNGANLSARPLDCHLTYILR